MSGKVRLPLKMLLFAMMIGVASIVIGQAINVILMLAGIPDSRYTLSAIAGFVLWAALLPEMNHFTKEDDNATPAI